MIQTWYDEAVGLSDTARAGITHGSSPMAAPGVAGDGTALDTGGIGAAPIAPPGSTS